MENAEVYMLLLRKTTMAPVFGESIEMGPFFGQIVLDSWGYNFKNEKHPDSADGASGDPQDVSQLLRRAEDYERRGDPESMRRAGQLRSQVARAQQATQAAQARRVDNLSDQVSEGADAAASPTTWLDKVKDLNQTFEFKKTLCTGTTQMLNMMKAGVPFQSALITVVHRAGIWSKVPGFLSVLLTDVFITKYSLSCDQSDTNTTLSENWECMFKHVTFKYFRRTDAPYGNVAQKVHQGVLAAQGGITFIMKPRAWMFS